MVFKEYVKAEQNALLIKHSNILIKKYIFKMEYIT